MSDSDVLSPFERAEAAAIEFLRREASFERAKSRQRATKELPLKPSLRLLGLEFGVSKSAVDRHLTVLRSTTVRRRVGRPDSLTEAEEEALIAFIKWYHDSRAPASPAQVRSEANTMRASRNQPPVSRHWYPAFIKRHSHILESRSRVKPVDVKRKAFEATATESEELSR